MDAAVRRLGLPRDVCPHADPMQDGGGHRQGLRVAGERRQPGLVGVHGRAGALRASGGDQLQGSRCRGCGHQRRRGSADRGSPVRYRCRQQHRQGDLRRDRRRVQRHLRGARGPHGIELHHYGGRRFGPEVARDYRRPGQRNADDGVRTAEHCRYRVRWRRRERGRAAV